jgi:hypothetical protein
MNFLSIFANYVASPEVFALENTIIYGGKISKVVGVSLSVGAVALAILTGTVAGFITSATFGLLAYDFFVLGETGARINSCALFNTIGIEAFIGSATLREANFLAISNMLLKETTVLSKAC